MLIILFFYDNEKLCYYAKSKRGTVVSSVFLEFRLFLRYLSTVLQAISSAGGLYKTDLLSASNGTIQPSVNVCVRERERESMCRQSGGSGSDCCITSRGCNLEDA